MIDSLDMHAVVGDGEAFREAVGTLLRDFESGVLSFDRDVAVSVFEASIRVLGGLVRHKPAFCVAFRVHGRYPQSQFSDKRDRLVFHKIYCCSVWKRNLAAKKNSRFFRSASGLCWSFRNGWWLRRIEITFVQDTNAHSFYGNPFFASFFFLKAFKYKKNCCSLLIFGSLTTRSLVVWQAFYSGSKRLTYTLHNAHRWPVCTPCVHIHIFCVTTGYQGISSIIFFPSFFFVFFCWSWNMNLQFYLTTALLYKYKSSVVLVEQTSTVRQFSVRYAASASAFWNVFRVQ